MKKQFSLAITIIMALGIAQSAFAQEYIKHIVQPYETVYSIPVHYNITTNDFLAVNNFDIHVKLLPGSEVLIRELTAEDLELAKNDKPVETKPKKLTHYEKLLAEEKGKTNSTHFTSPEADKSAAPVVTEPVKTEKPVVAAIEKPVEPVAIAPVKTEKPAVTAPAKIEKPVVTASAKTEKPIVVAPAKTTEVKANVSSDKAEDIGPNGVRYKISKTGYHLVEPKQTLFHLALIYNQTVEHLKQINSLPTTDISVGQKLKVSN